MPVGETTRFLNINENLPFILLFWYITKKKLRDCHKLRPTYISCTKSETEEISYTCRFIRSFNFKNLRHHCVGEILKESGGKALHRLVLEFQGKGIWFLQSQAGLRMSSVLNFRLNGFVPGSLNIASACLNYHGISSSGRPHCY